MISPVAPAGSVAPRGVDDLRFVAEGRPRAAELALRRVQRIGEAGRRGFGEAHGLDDADAELLLEGQVLRRRQRCRGRAAEADRRAIEPSVARSGPFSR
jgi:hypothetical protein